MARWKWLSEKKREFPNKVFPGFYVRHRIWELKHSEIPHLNKWHFFLFNLGRFSPRGMKSVWSPCGIENVKLSCSVASETYSMCSSRHRWNIRFYTLQLVIAILPRRRDLISRLNYGLVTWNRQFNSQISSNFCSSLSRLAFSKQDFSIGPFFHPR